MLFFIMGLVQAGVATAIALVSIDVSRPHSKSSDVRRDKRRKAVVFLAAQCLSLWSLYSAGQQSVRLSQQKAILALQVAPGEQLIVREVYTRPDGERRAIVTRKNEPEQEYWFPAEPDTFIGEPLPGATVPRFKVGDPLVVTADRKVDWAGSPAR